MRMPESQDEFQIPETMGACADLLFTTRQRRLLLQKKVEKLEGQETKLKNHIINNLSVTDTGAQGRIARVSVVKKEVPQVEDWEAFYKYVSRTKQFDLLQKRTADGAIKERWEAKKQIPGVVKFTTKTVSLNKI